MFAKTTPKAPPGFTNVKNGRASVTGYAVHKITGLAGEMATRQKKSSMFLRLRSRLYATKDGCGKIPPVC